jgi:hypothetical protein
MIAPTRTVLDIGYYKLIKWSRCLSAFYIILYFFRKDWFPWLTPTQNERFSVLVVTWAFCWRRLLKGPKSPCDCAIGLLVIYWLVRQRSMWAWKTSRVPCDRYCSVSYIFYEHWNYSFLLNCLGPLPLWTKLEWKSGIHLDVAGVSKRIIFCWIRDSYIGTVKSTAFCCVTPFRPVHVIRRFGETYCLHLQRRINSKQATREE